MWGLRGSNKTSKHVMNQTDLNRGWLVSYPVVLFVWYQISSMVKNVPTGEI